MNLDRWLDINVRFIWTINHFLNWLKSKKVYYKILLTIIIQIISQPNNDNKNDYDQGYNHCQQESNQKYGNILLLISKVCI